MEKISDVQNILVAGNGFDLHHCLPTRYLDFLNIIQRLMELERDGKLDKCQYLAYVLGAQSPLYESDMMVKRCYDVHKSVIDKTRLDTKTLKKMVNLAKKNIWMKFFIERNEKKGGWVDFENEIALIIRAFTNLIENMDKVCKELGVEVYVDDLGLSKEDRYFMTSKAFSELYKSDEEKTLKKEFWNILEENGEDIFLSVNSKKIAERLYSHLEDFVKILNWYIIEFVQKVAVTKQSKNNLFIQCDRVITFNYTNTFSILYDKSCQIPVSFVHGSAQMNNMVLGIDSDESDQMGTLDLSFVEFKKYYQRAFFNTDYNLKNNLPEGGKYMLHFVGHSMDVTDQDILKALIRNKKVTESIVYYHDKDSHRQVITNVIALFGKDEFDELRLQNKIRFEKLESFE